MNYTAGNWSAAGALRCSGFQARVPACSKPGGGVGTWERHDGVHDRDYLAESKAVDWPDGRRVHLAFVTDVTRERKAEQALRDANADLEKTVGKLAATNAELLATNRELQDFANIVAHDFRTPMVNLQGFSRELGNSLADLQQIIQDRNPNFPQMSPNGSMNC